MLYDATGTPLRANSPKGAEKRAATTAERQYVQRCVRNERRMARIAVFFFVALSPIFVYLGLTEGEPAALVIGVLSCLVLAAGMRWVYRRSYTLTVADEPTVQRIRGRYRTAEGWGGATHFIGDQAVKVPVHWTSYLREGRPVEAAVIATNAEPYVVATGNGLSVEDEIEQGLFDLVDPSVGPLRGMMLAPAVVAFFFLAGTLLLAVSEGGNVGSRLTLRSAVVLYALIGAVGFGSVAGWVLYGHLRARRRIHRMYYERSIAHALSPAQRRRFRLRNAGLVAPIFALGGWGLAELFALHLGATLLVCFVVGGAFGAVVQEPAPADAE